MKHLSFILVLLSLAMMPAGELLAEDGAWVPLGPPGGEINHLLVHPRNPQILWAGTPLYGIYKSIDGGASWSPVHEGLTRRPVRALAIAPSDPRILYAATGQTEIRVHRSSDGGETWTVVLRCGTEPPPCCGCVPLAEVRELVVHPRAPRTVFAATQRGLFQSDDGGARWRRTRLSARSVDTLVFEPGNPDVLHAGSAGRLFKSTNGGSSWRLWSDSVSGLEIQHLVIDPRNPRRMWAGGSSGNGVALSTDGGVRWRLSRAGLPNPTVAALALAPAAGAELPVVWMGNHAGLFRSLDGGVTWRGALRNRSVGAIATHPSERSLVWIGTKQNRRRFPIGIYKSANGGATWTFSSRGIFHAVASSLAFDPVAPAVLWAASSGVFRSTDGGATWVERSGNLPIAEDFFVLELAIDPHDPQTLWAGTTRGVFITEDGGATWEARREGLSVPGAQPYAQTRILRLAPSRSSVAYMGAFAGLFKTVDAGEHWTLLPAPPSAPDTYVEDVLVDPRDPDVVFVAWGDVWVSRDGGASWAKVPVGNGSAFFRLAVDPRAPDVLYAGGEKGIFRSTDGGQTWQLVTGLPVPWQGNLAVGPTGEVWAGSTDGIYVSPDGTTGWTLLPGLLAAYLFVLEADPHHPSTVYAGAAFTTPTGPLNGLFRHADPEE